MNTFKTTNENGFSLIELTVSVAIIATLGGLAFTTIIPAAQTIVEKAEEVKAIQAEKEAEEAHYLDSLLNP